MASFGHSRWAMEQQLYTSRPPLPGAHLAGLGSRQKLSLFLWLEFPHKTALDGVAHSGNV